MSSRPIYVIDEFETKPGQGPALIKYYLGDYAPSAVERGMTLERILVSPPVWMDDQPNTVTITWTLPHVGAWWRMSATGRYDPEVAAWWEGASPMAAKRSRQFSVEHHDVEAFSNV